MALTAAEVYAAAVKAGFAPDDAVTITAIAGAESGWNPRAYNPRPPDNSYGLTQVNMIGSLGPARRRQFGLASNEALFDPLTNLRAAYAISGGGRSWTPWTTYTSGSYRKYLPAAQAAASGGGGAGAGGAANAIFGLPSPLDQLKDNLDPRNWAAAIAERGREVGVELAFVALGIGLVAAGLYRAVMPQVKAAGQKAAGDVLDVVGGGQ